MCYAHDNSNNTNFHTSLKMIINMNKRGLIITIIMPSQDEKSGYYVVSNYYPSSIKGIVFLFLLLYSALYPTQCCHFCFSLIACCQFPLTNESSTS